MTPADQFKQRAQDALVKPRQRGDEPGLRFSPQMQRMATPASAAMNLPLNSFQLPSVSKAGQRGDGPSRIC